jgi:hypothetical protein
MGRDLAMARIEIKVIAEDEKKQTIRYADKGGWSGLSSIYIPKPLIFTAQGHTGYPKEMTITFEWEDEK